MCRTDYTVYAVSFISCTSCRIAHIVSLITFINRSCQPMAQRAGSSGAVRDVVVIPECFGEGVRERCSDIIRLNRSESKGLRQCAIAQGMWRGNNKCSKTF